MPVSRKIPPQPRRYKINCLVTITICSKALRRKKKSKAGRRIQTPAMTVAKHNERGRAGAKQKIHEAIIVEIGAGWYKPRGIAEGSLDATDMRNTEVVGAVIEQQERPIYGGGP